MPASTFKIVSASAALQNGYTAEPDLPVPARAAGRRPQVPQLRGRGARPGRPGQGARGLLRHDVVRQSPTAGGARTAASRPVAKPKDPIEKMAKAYGYGKRTGIDLPSESRGRVGGRAFKTALNEQLHDAWCKRAVTGYPEVAKTDPQRARLPQGARQGELRRRRQSTAPVTRSTSPSARATPSSRPLQVAQAYAALANGGTIYAAAGRQGHRRPATARSSSSIKPKVTGKLPVSQGQPRVPARRRSREVTSKPYGTGYNAVPRLPARQDPGRGQDRHRPGRDRRRPVDLVVRDLRAGQQAPKYAVVMMVSQGGTGAGHERPERPQDLRGDLRRQRQQRRPVASRCSSAERPRRSCRRSSRTARRSTRACRVADRRARRAPRRRRRAARPRPPRDVGDGSSTTAPRPIRRATSPVSSPSRCCSAGLLDRRARRRRRGPPDAVDGCGRHDAGLPSARPQSPAPAAARPCAAQLDWLCSRRRARALGARARCWCGRRPRASCSTYEHRPRGLPEEAPDQPRRSASRSRCWSRASTTGCCAPTPRSCTVRLDPRAASWCSRRWAPTINGAQAWIVLPGGLHDPAVGVREDRDHPRHGDAALGEARRRERAARHRRALRARCRRRCPSALIMLQPDLGTVMVIACAVFGIIAVSGAKARWLVGILAGGAIVAVRRRAGRDPQAVPGRPAHGVRRPGQRPARHRLQHPAGAHRDRVGRAVRHRAVPRPADPGPVRARTTRPTSSTPWRARSSASSARPASSCCSACCCGARCASRCAPRTCSAGSWPPASPCWIALPGVREHRHEPRDHAGDGRAPAVRLLRRHLACSRTGWPSACSSTST